MKDYIDQLVRSLLQKHSIEECSLQELKELANDHPYFGAAQLLLAKKLQKEDSPEYAAQVEKTSLFFNNPFWLDQLLNEEAGLVIEDKIRVSPGTSAEELKPAPVNNGEEIARMISAGAVKSGEEEKPGTSKQHVEILKEEYPLPEKVEFNTEQVPSTIETVPGSQTLREPQAEPVREEFKSTDFIFEPYHTVDYFASQGIRFREEEKPADKFGQQLKSFTEWLKTLKRLPVTEIAKQTSPASEQKVEEMAEASLTEGEVITEAMAEVWIKQGYPDKALRIYEKLSLLEPSKSAYFADKIEDLKR